MAPLARRQQLSSAVEDAANFSIKYFGRGLVLFALDSFGVLFILVGPYILSCAPKFEYHFG